MAISFKAEFTFEQRLSELRDMIAKYSDRVPVIAERYCKTDLPQMEKKNFDEGVIHLVDSMPDDSRSRQCSADVDSMKVHLYLMLFEKLPPHNTFDTPRIMDFKIEIPKYVPKQTNGDDCGLWVANWMMHADHSYDYWEEIVHELRAPLAISLVMDVPNQMRSTIRENAAEHAPKFTDIIARRKRLVERKNRNWLRSIRADVSSNETSTDSTHGTHSRI